MEEKGIEEAEADDVGIDLTPPPYRTPLGRKVQYKPDFIYTQAIEKLQAKIDELREHFDTSSDKDMFVGTAFVTLND